MKRPYLAPKDGGGSDHVVSVDLGRAPWEQSRPEGRVPKRSRSPKPEPAHHDPWAAPKLERDVNTGLSLAPESSAENYTKEDAASFWSLPSIPAITKVPEPPIRPPTDEDSLSGTGQDFDTSTGWTFAAVQEPEDLAPILDMSDAERSQPVLPSVDELFSGELPAVAWSRPPTAPGAEVPKPPPQHQRRTGPHPGAAAPVTGSHQRVAPAGVNVEPLLTRARELLSSGEIPEALKLLGQARRKDPNNNSVATWLEFGQRRLLREYLPDASTDSVARLTAPRRDLAAQATGLEKQLLAALDGRRTLGRLLSASNDDAYVTMLQMLAAFTARGWVTWA